MRLEFGNRTPCAIRRMVITMSMHGGLLDLTEIQLLNALENLQRKFGKRFRQEIEALF